MNYDDRIVFLLHDLTQKGYIVRFLNDFSGMITISVSKLNTLSTHHHVGSPQGKLKDLERDVRNCLASYLEEG